MNNVFCFSQIFGGNGFNSEYPVEKLMRDAKIYQVKIIFQMNLKKVLIIMFLFIDL